MCFCFGKPCTSEQNSRYSRGSLFSFNTTIHSCSNIIHFFLRETLFCMVKPSERVLYSHQCSKQVNRSSIAAHVSVLEIRGVMLCFCLELGHAIYFFRLTNSKTNSKQDGCIYFRWRFILF